MENLKLTPRELEFLSERIEQDVRGAINDHQTRMDRCKRWFRAWRNRIEVPLAVDKERSNVRVPLLQWVSFAKWAQTVQAIFGAEAQVVAVATTPENERVAPKVGAWMTWRLFTSMRATKKIAIWLLRAIIYGRSHAYRPWIKTYTDTPKGPRVAYEGPGFEPLSPDDIIVPAEPGVLSIQDFSWVVRKWMASPEELVDGEKRDKKYFGVVENYAKIMNLADSGPSRDIYTDEIHWEEDDSEGVQRHNSGRIRGGQVRVWEWYGRWRMPLKGEPEATDWANREMIPVDIQVTYLPDSHQIIGVRRLVDLYGYMENKRPFAEVALCEDGTYWCMGYGEMLESSEMEMTAMHQMGTEAVERSVLPPVFYVPGNGMDPKQHRFKPGFAYPTARPEAVKTLDIKPNLEGVIALTQRNEEIAEKVTGVSAQTMGQSIDRPNAPRTATGQLALIQQGNVRLALDTLFFREDLATLCRDLWEMDSEFITDSTFFRVTEEQSNGVLARDRRSGGMVMTQAEFGGKYDFRLQFANDVWSREKEKQDRLTLYQIDLNNPLIAQNPSALWDITAKLHKSFNDSNFELLVPKPPAPDLPLDPKREWTMILEGEEVHCNPQDNDDSHLIAHHMQLEDEKDQGEELRDTQAIHSLIGHIFEHEKQKRAKMMMAAMAQVVAGQLAQAHEQGHQELQQAALQQIAQQGGGAGQPGAQQGIQPAFQNVPALQSQLVGGSIQGRVPPQSQGVTNG
jgi:hypothetical protein